jgi:hypothetical protein
MNSAFVFAFGHSRLNANSFVLLSSVPTESEAVFSLAIRQKELCGWEGAYLMSVEIPAQEGIVIHA